jgi:hypothetical protein
MTERPEKHPGDCGCDDCGHEEELVPDDLVAGIDPDCAPGGLVSYTGYLQPDGDCPGQWRLNLDLGLDDYLLLRHEDIVAQRQTGDVSIVWVRRDRVVKHVRARTPDQHRLDVLEGTILELWRAAAPPTSPSIAARGGPPDSTPPCPQSKPGTWCRPCT